MQPTWGFAKSRPAAHGPRRPSGPLVTEQYLNMEVPLVGIPFNLSVLLPLLTNYYLM